MAPSYPYLSYFWAAYAITALIYLGYAFSLWQRHLALRTRTLKHVLVAQVETRLHMHQADMRVPGTESSGEPR